MNQQCRVTSDRPIYDTCMVMLEEYVRHYMHVKRALNDLISIHDRRKY